MATLDQQIEQNVSIITADTLTLHNIVHGTETETITTDSGEVPTMAKVVKDNQDVLASSISDITTLHNEVETNKNIVEEKTTDVETIKTEVATLRDEMAAIFNNVGDSIGQFAFFASENIPDGWLRCDGSTINKTTYPSLVAYLNNGDTEAESAVLPNAIHADGRGRFLRDIGLNETALDVQDDALQNITGTFRGGDADNDFTSGAFTYLSTMHSSIAGGGTAQICNYSFDASKVARTSDETRPLSLFGVLCIKAFHGVINTGNVDTTGLAADTQNNIARLDLLEDKGTEVILWDNADPLGTFNANGSVATLNESLFNYKEIILLGGFNNPLTDRQTQERYITSTLQDGLIIYASNAGSAYYEMVIGNNGTTLTSGGYSGSNIRFKRVIGIK